MSRRRLSAGATFAAVGVVSGDIGTSPLYALQQSLGATDGDANSPATVLDVLSLMFWSLLVVVTLEYVARIMRADNGEGGILSLFAWMQRRSTQTVEFFRMADKRVIVLATQVEL